MQQTGNKGLCEHSLIENEMAGVGVDNISHEHISSIRALSETHNEDSENISDSFMHMYWARQR